MATVEYVILYEEVFFSLLIILQEKTCQQYVVESGLLKCGRKYAGSK